MILTLSAWLAAVTASVAVLALTREPTCTVEEFNGCLASLMSVTQGNDLALAVTRIQLLAVCRTLQGSLTCVDDHMKLCFTPTQRKVFNDVVAGARQVLTELCVPGAIQEGYLAYALCFRNISLSEEKCAPKYRHLVQVSENVNKEQNVDEGLRESCCAFSEFVLCKYTHVNQDCGHDAVEFLQKHLDKIANPLLHEHCEHYLYKPGTCTSGSSSIAAYLKASSILMFIMYYSIIINQLCETLIL